jgi:hypothetical protein
MVLINYPVSEWPKNKFPDIYQLPSFIGPFQ